MVNKQIISYGGRSTGRLYHTIASVRVSLELDEITKVASLNIDSFKDKFFEATGMRILSEQVETNLYIIKKG